MFDPVVQTQVGVFHQGFQTGENNENRRRSDEVFVIFEGLTKVSEQLTLSPPRKSSCCCEAIELVVELSVLPRCWGYFVATSQ